MGLTRRFRGDYAPDPVEGPPQGFYADGHNPTRLAKNLEQTRVFVSTGTGVPSRGLASPTREARVMPKVLPWRVRSSIR